MPSGDQFFLYPTCHLDTCLSRLTDQQLTTTTTITPAATAQLPEEIGPIDRVHVPYADPEAASFAIGIATSVLWDLTDKEPWITLQEDGRMQMTRTFNTEKGWVSVSVSIPHNLTPENGYHIDNGVLFAPNGTAIFP